MTTKEMQSQIADTPELVNAYAMLAMKGRLTLESKGMRCRGQSALSWVKSRFGIKARTAKAALPLYVKILEDKGILKPAGSYTNA